MTLAKPESCSTCILATSGHGWVPPSGPVDSPLVVIGEAPGAREVGAGLPLHPTGESGGMFARWLNFTGHRREEFLLHNTLSCKFPGEDLAKQHFAESALQHCRPNLDRALGQAQVVLALGGTATRELLALPRAGFSLKDWHGTVIRDPTDRFWVVPTFHPAHLTRGAHALLGVAVMDTQRAITVAQNASAGIPWAGEPAELVVDPPVDWFRAWASMVLEECERNPALWLACDTETTEKLKTTDEGDLVRDQDETEIERMNFAINGEQGITVLFAGSYIEECRRLLLSSITKLWWNKPYDFKHLRTAGIVPEGHNLDFMWAWHALQSDLPRGLGFVSPIFSGFGAWKHLSQSDPGKYAAIDPIQTWRNAAGIAALLQHEGRWDAFWRHMHLCDVYLFAPSVEIGLLVDRPYLEEKFKPKVDAEVERLWGVIQEQAPEEVRRFDPKEGLKREPVEALRKNPDFEKNPGSPEFLPLVAREVQAETQLCETCGVSGVNLKHVCKDAAGKPDRGIVPVLTKRVMSTTRWFSRRQFNPNSPDQILEAILALKHTPGKDPSKASGWTTDKLTLERLSKHAQPEATRAFYRAVLDYREVKRIKSGYVDSTLRRLDEPPRDGRLHPEVTHRPSTLRTSYINPNLQNQAARSKLALEFRECLIAGEDPE